jgi:hypothetical protein
MSTLNLKPAHKAVNAYPLVPKLHLGTQILPHAQRVELK